MKNTIRIGALAAASALALAACSSAPEETQRERCADDLGRRTD